MGNYAWLICDPCPEFMWLGKIYVDASSGSTTFHARMDPTPNWKRDNLNEVLWAFLADHLNHHLTVADDRSFGEIMTKRGDVMYEIGGDWIRDLTTDEYLARRKQKRSSDGSG